MGKTKGQLILVRTQVIGKKTLQGVLALCEFHYCEFHYCGFSKLHITKIWLMRLLG